MSKIEALKNRLFNKEETDNLTGLHAIIDMSREFGCLQQLLGAEFEVFNANGKLLYVVKQKPLTIAQTKLLVSLLGDLREKESKQLKTSKPTGRRR